MQKQTEGLHMGNGATFYSANL